MPEEVQRNDLVYEAMHIGTEGPAMTHSMLAIDWLQMQNKTAGDYEFEASYKTNLLGPFLQWMECPIPPDNCQNHRPATNFLTAAGGFLQVVLYGYLGLRYNDANMTLLGPTLALNTTRMVVRGLKYREARLKVEWDSAATILSCVDGCARARLCATTSVGGKVERLMLGASAQFLAGAKLLVTPCEDGKWRASGSLSR